MGKIVNYSISRVGNLNIDEDEDYEIEDLALTYISGYCFSGNLILNLDNEKIVFHEISVFDALLGILGELLNCLSETADGIERDILILDSGSMLHMRLNDYEIELNFHDQKGSCDFKQLYREVYQSIKKIIDLMYKTKPELALRDISEGDLYNNIRYNWILENKLSVPEPLRAKLLSSISRLL